MANSKYPSLALREEIKKREKKLVNFRKFHKKVFDAELKHNCAIANAKLDLVEQCKHELHITVYSYYEGSYSYDRDDWHTGLRLCLICGFQENTDSKGNWKVLTNPKYRFEMPPLYGDVPEYVIKNRFGHKNFPYMYPQNFPFEEVMAFVEKHGY